MDRWWEVRCCTIKTLPRCEPEKEKLWSLHFLPTSTLFREKAYTLLQSTTTWRDAMQRGWGRFMLRLEFQLLSLITTLHIYMMNHTWPQRQMKSATSSGRSKFNTIYFVLVLAKMLIKLTSLMVLTASLVSTIFATIFNTAKTE